MATKAIAMSGRKKTDFTSEFSFVKRPHALNDAPCISVLLTCDGGPRVPAQDYAWSILTSPERRFKAPIRFSFRNGFS